MKGFVEKATNTRFKAMDLRLNDLVVQAIAILLAVSLFMGRALDSIVPVNVLIYLLLASLVIINWPRIKNIRLGTSIIVGISILLLMLSIVKVDIIDEYSLRLFSILLSVIALTSIRLSQKTIDHISSYMFVLLSYYSLKSFNYYDTFTRSNALTFDYSVNTNPNTMSLIVLFSFMFADRASLMGNKLLRAITIVVAGVGIYNYGSRNALVGLALYLIFAYVLKFSGLKMKKAILTTILALGLLIPVLYVSSYNNSWLSSGTGTFLGKDIYSGRQEIWSEALVANTTQNLVLGNSDLSLLKTLPSNSLHNMYLDISFKKGVVFLLVYLLIIRLFIYRNINMSNKMLASIFVLLTYGYFESSFQTGDYASILMLTAFIYSGMESASNAKKTKVLDKYHA